MSFDQGLSGLNAADTQLDVIGNNIANASTVGFKSSDVEFADVYAASLGGGGAPPVGIGVSASDISQTFSQGTITTTNNPLDTAINGNGFFQVSENGTISYTRNGQFQLNADGDIVTANGANVQGYNANSSGVLNTSQTTNLVINSANIPPAITSTANLSLNLDSSDPVLTEAGFDPATQNTYSFSTSVNVYDSLGNEHSMQTYYVNLGPTGTGGENQWAVYAAVDGNLIGGSSPAVPISTFSFTSGGSLDATNTTPVTTPAFQIPVSIPLTNGATTPQTVTINFTGTTAYGDTSSQVYSVQQNGYSSGQLTQFSTGPTGIITGTYSNGQTQTLGQVVLDTFVNPGGLAAAGNNQWYASATSGAAILGTPGSGSFGTLQSNAVEDSNTDLTTELVSMITAQQNYQANAQTIKTQDEITQTLVTLR